MWDVIKTSDVVLEAINPVSTMAIFIASRLFRKKIFETLFTMVELKEAYHTHVHTPTHTNTRIHTHTHNKTIITSPNLYIRNIWGKNT